MVLLRGDYIQYRDDCIVRLHHIFTHEILLDVRRLFAVITPTIRTGKLDDWTGLPLLQLVPRREIVGLPLIHSRRLYILPVKEEQSSLSWQREENVKPGTKLLFVEWDLEFL